MSLPTKLSFVRHMGGVGGCGFGDGTVWMWDIAGTTAGVGTLYRGLAAGTPHSLDGQGDDLCEWSRDTERVPHKRHGRVYCNLGRERRGYPSIQLPRGPSLDSG